ncbi:hypothetical protein KM176_05515 [Pseudooceanicola sp. CBS1P-1]|uniref:Uncharacterized protein n=1 Tax=Pseudooceanicola albus TaxID=2692189 RepID=A0A6L7FZ23_9RHOB|nr:MULTISPECIES: hypothetical protein [Pseudooceanicola]MBT9383310.1 hypothetical protein [Pseudooceanicola endophyticus]MXN16367.1 hypothetical protein [Pseudooceanicola albus]
MSRLANAPAVHFDLEPFRAFATRELGQTLLSPAGVCMNPACSCPFVPCRPWQAYCSDTCRKADEAEMRRVGQRAAPALLAWRLGKYEIRDEALRDLSRAGRRYIGQLQTEWLTSRQNRAQAAKSPGRGPGL